MTLLLSRHSFIIIMDASSSSFILDIGDLLVTDPVTFPCESKGTRPTEKEIKKRAVAAYHHL